MRELIFLTPLRPVVIAISHDPTTLVLSAVAFDVKISNSAFEFEIFLNDNIMVARACKGA